MGKNKSLFRCDDCRTDWWEWFEWLDRDELINFAKELECPGCGSSDWEMTDTNRFSGGKLKGTVEDPLYD